MIAKTWLLGLFIMSTMSAVVNSQLLQAIAHVRDGTGRIQGNITFSQNDGGTVTIWGKVIGLPPGRHGFHVHEIGDITSSCTSTGGHYNPFKKKHGALIDPERHVGDLGNIIASPEGVALISITDNVISLTGPYTILGRSIVIHADPDDFGKGVFPDSMKTGHAGPKIACGIIGLLTPLDKLYEMSSATSVVPWKYFLLIIFTILRFSY